MNTKNIAEKGKNLYGVVHCRGKAFQIGIFFLNLTMFSKLLVKKSFGRNFFKISAEFLYS